MTAHRVVGLSGSTVLVTGAGGFIGCHLSAALRDAGARVVGFSRQMPASGQAGVQYLEGDLANAGQVGEAVSDLAPDYVFHLASLKNKATGMDDLRAALRNDVFGTLNLVEACLRAGSVKRFVHLGSCEVYGGMEAPFREQAREAPVSAYSYAKVSVSHLLQMLGGLHNFAAVELRPSVVYGPGQPAGMFVPTVIASLLAGKHFPMSEGEQTRDFVYVGDVVEAMLLAAVNPDCSGQIINVSSGSPVSIRRVAAMVAEQIGGGAHDLLGIGEQPYRSGEAMQYWADNSKAEAVLGWKPRVPLSDGLSRSIDYYRRSMCQTNA